jgi:hypothetical protein
VTATIENVHQTGFGMYVPCDWKTYKKLKRINHLLHQHVQPWADRWERSQRRLPKNRVFRIRGERLTVKDSWVFPQFFSAGLKATDLLNRFRADRNSAYEPKASPDDVKTLSLSEAEIDQLLADIESFVKEKK